MVWTRAEDVLTLMSPEMWTILFNVVVEISPTKGRPTGLQVMEVYYFQEKRKLVGLKKKENKRSKERKKELSHT